MKKIFSFILTLVCVTVFSGCGNSALTSQPDAYPETVYQEITEAVVSESEISDDETENVPAYEGETEQGKEEDIFVPPDETEEQEITEAEPEITEAGTEAAAEETAAQTEEELQQIDINGTYTSKEDVALYIYTYGKLPDNFISKKDAEALGWSGGSLEPYAPGKCIGGSRFGNYEGILPDRKGRKYTECDIDTLGASKRGAKRIVFSNDGLIYYTEDHYETFELLYGDED